MKIRDDNNAVSRGNQPQTRPVEAARSEAAGRAKMPGQPSDRVELSERARALHLANQTLAQLPATREEKVQTLQQMVKADAYRVSAEQVAQRMLGEGVFA